MGWQVASDGNWLDLETFLGGEEDDLSTFANSAARLLGIGDLLKPLGENTDSGFDAEFGGYVNGPNTEIVTDLGENGQWWTSTQVGTNLIYRNVENSTTGISRIAQPVETYAFSIRCIKD